MSFDAGHIAIDLRDGVSIASTRPAAIGRVFRGKSPKEAKALVPLLFAVCGKAQQAACALALGAAEGGEADGQFTGLVTLEAIREHLMRIAADWAKALGDAAAPEQLRRIHGLARRDDVSARDEALSLMTALAVEPASVIRHGAAAFDNGQTIAARLLRMVASRRWQALGAVLDEAPELSCFTLVRHHPLVAETVARHGEGLLARLLARIAHLTMLFATLADGGAVATVSSPQPGQGAASVTTARGMLEHRAIVVDGTIADYEIAAPTDCNFAAEGPVSRSLVSLAANCHDELEAPSRLLIEAYDPCVSYSLRVH